jgi:hypothetical protein
MNRQAVALAADSAVTIETSEGDSKAWQSANKIFGLSRHHSVGVMIYGSADFMRVPWETVIKMYRDQLGDQSLKTLADYADDMLAFIAKNRKLFPPKEQSLYVGGTTMSRYDAIRRDIEERADAVIQANGSVTTAETAAIVQDTIQEHHDFHDVLQQVRRDYFSGPIIDVVAVLPKDELASMAESLVSLTSFRRKVSLQVETVGGPIDVAVISKGDGFVWIRRKNYFDLTNNAHFVAKYLA